MWQRHRRTLLLMSKPILVNLHRHQPGNFNFTASFWMWNMGISGIGMSERLDAFQGGRGEVERVGGLFCRCTVEPVTFSLFSPAPATYFCFY